ncbi:MAG: hypothetical protein IJZ25_03165 [Lachnospiraceae bacterium]|nr:hypothetical protein [Lachnospiraceae bacterium]
MKYSDIKEYLLSPEMNVSIPGLKRIKSVLKYMGNPQNKLKIIHVVGSNGKGSVSHMLSEVLTDAGIKTGLFTSPYITELTEYVKLNNNQISKDSFAEIASKLIAVLQKTDLKLTHFEFVTVLSVLYFVEEGCEVCIYEAGLGGVKDATNIFPKALCTVLTSVSVEHSSYLGNTLEEIVAQKAGIARKGEILVSSDCSEEDTLRNVTGVNGIIEGFCCNKKIILRKVGCDFKITGREINRITFDYKKLKDIVINSGALYQVKNAITVIETCEVLKDIFNICDSNIINGLADFKLGSRFEIIKNKPMIIVDGGHNPACVNELVKSLDGNDKYVIVTGVMADKDYQAMYSKLAKYAKCFICVDNNISRALLSNGLCKELEEYGLPVYDAGNTFVAASLVNMMCSEEDKVLFAGTLYMTDDFKRDLETVYNADKISSKYNEIISRLTSKSFYSKNFSLEDMRKVLAEFDNPQEKIKYIHVAGTNGKGSTCSMIASSLDKYGYKTGLFTSPYITRFNERIRFNSEEISDSLLTSICLRILNVQEKLNIDLNQFALVTCICFVYYNLVKADYVVLETGLGGTYDPTNIIEKPVCTVITNIGYDHTAVLGDSIEQIASAKAGIIKPGIPVVCYPVVDDAFKVIKNKAEESKSTLYKLNKDDVKIFTSDISGTVFEYEGEKFHTSMSGDFQAYNATVALKVLRLIMKLEISKLIDSGEIVNSDDCKVIVLKFYESAKAGLSDVKWKGRLEPVSENPLCFIDGGHNIQCIEHVTDYFNSHYADKKRIYIAGFMKDKEYKNMIKVLSENADMLYLVPVSNERSLSFKELTDEAKNYNINVKVMESLNEAFRTVKNMCGEESVICIIGSLYQIDDFYKLFDDGGLHERE